MDCAIFLILAVKNVLLLLLNDIIEVNRKYPLNLLQDSHCEWLIKARNDSQFITLKFQSMGTECSYDYIFVYDGDSFRSPLLGSFSGKTEPQQVIATSGSVSTIYIHRTATGRSVGQGRMCQIIFIRTTLLTVMIVSVMMDDVVVGNWRIIILMILVESGIVEKKFNQKQNLYRDFIGIIQS